MDEINKLLAQWEEGSYINPDALEAAYKAVALLAAKIEALEASLQSLE